MFILLVNLLCFCYYCYIISNFIIIIIIIIRPYIYALFYVLVYRQYLMLKQCLTPFLLSLPIIILLILPILPILLLLLVRSTPTITQQYYPYKQPIFQNFIKLLRTISLIVTSFIALNYCCLIK